MDNRFKHFDTAQDLMDDIAFTKVGETFKIGKKVFRRIKWK